MSSHREKHPMTSIVNPADPAELRAVYDRCSADEKILAREHPLKRQLVRELAFGGKDFDSKPGFSGTDSELAAKYLLLVEKFRKAQSADDRLRLFAQWLRVELDIKPEDSVGGKMVDHLSSNAVKRVNTIPWNDFYLSRLVEIWLPYCERLLRDSGSVRTASGNVEKDLLARGYDQFAALILATNRKQWRSAIEFTCEWLATRGGIRMVKPRKEGDIARTLRNAHSRMSGKNARRLFERVF